MQIFAYSCQMIERQLVKRLTKLAASFPVIALTGPRQIGKTTLAKQFQTAVKKDAIFLDLENTDNYQSLSNDTQQYLIRHQEKLLVIDEVQRMKTLFPLLRYVVDKHRVPLRFLLLGSASPDMIRDSSETLAGRIAYEELMGLSLTEVGENSFGRLWFRGGFPEPFLNDDDETRRDWFNNFVFTYVQRDLPSIGLSADPTNTQKLWTMLANMHGNIINYSTLADGLQMSVNTVRKYIDYLEEAYLIVRLQPYYANLNKRLVKTPKVYIRDSGVLHYFHGLKKEDDLFNHSIIGPSFEGFVIEQLRNAIGKNAQLYFFGTYNSGELDLVIARGVNIIAAIEVKYNVAPTLTRGNKSAIADLKAKHNYIIVPSGDTRTMQGNITVCSLYNFLKEELIGIV